MNTQQILTCTHGTVHIFYFFYRNIGITTTVGLFGISRCFLGFSKKKAYEDPVLDNVKRAKLASAGLLDGDAEKYYHNALYFAENKFRDKEIERKDYLNAKTYIFDGLADIALRQQKFDKAEKLYKETMKTYLQNGKDKNSNAMVELTIKLGTVYAIMKRDREARLGYQEAVKIQDEKVKNDPECSQDTYALLGLALESYGRFLLAHREIEAAEPLFKRSESIATKLLGKEHPQRINILNDIAACQILNGNLKDAEETLSDAVAVGTIGNVPELPALYSNLGALYLRISKLDDAEKNCGLALEKAKENKDKYAQGQAQFCLKKILEEREKETSS